MEPENQKMRKQSKQRPRIYKSNNGPQGSSIVLKIVQKFSASNTRALLSSVVSTLKKKNSAILEKVQRRTPRYNIRNIGRDMSYEERLKVLKWPTLHQRRLFSLLTECCRTVNSLNGLHPFQYFTLTHDFRP